MRIDFDTYKEIIDTLTRNKSRSLLTGFGIFWGIFMLVLLLGGGQGLQQLLQKQFEGFAQNSAIIFAQPTTKACDGLRKGRKWTMSLLDVKRLKAQVPELDVVSPMLFNSSTLVREDKKGTYTVKGVMPDYAKVEEPMMRYGRYINAIDMLQRRKVCVLGRRVYKTLFPKGGDPTGQVVRIDSTYYSVVGVDFSTGNMNVGSSSEESVTIPITLLQQTYNRGDEVDLICTTGRPGVALSKLNPRVRQIIGHNHHVDPTDEKAITIFNTAVLFGVIDSMFRGVNILVWLVGIGTLLAGAIGVSNIMMVTVRERTSEIGIRRAIGATPRMVLSQIIAESMVLTAVAGMSGILFAVLILQMLEMGNTTDGIVAARFQISFWTAAGAMLLLVLLGVAAGLAPALRAMHIKPVDAMREE
jgi:putative ABC transport system permease protein